MLVSCFLHVIPGLDKIRPVVHRGNHAQLKQVLLMEINFEVGLDADVAIDRIHRNFTDPHGVASLLPSSALSLCASGDYRRTGTC